MFSVFSFFLPGKVWFLNHPLPLFYFENEQQRNKWHTAWVEIVVEIRPNEHHKLAANASIYLE